MRNKFAKVSDPNSFVTEPGSPVHILYSSKVLKNGIIELTESGKEDIQEFIDSQRDSCDMAFILHQLAIGNESVLHQKAPMYGDFTTAPSTLAEAEQMLIDGENAFYQLPLDVRQQFDNDFRQWLYTAGNAEWIQKMVPVSGSDSGENPVEVESEVTE